MTRFDNMYRSRYMQPLDGARYFILLFMIWLLLGCMLLLWEQERWVYRTINGHYSPLGDTLFPWITHIGEGPVIITILLLLLLIPRLRTWKFTLALMVCNLSPFLLTQAIKGLVNAPRPLKYFAEAAWIHRVPGQPLNYDFSFPSGHSEGSFAFLCFLSLLLPARYRYLGAVFFLIALSVVYSRMYLSQHFYADVYTGSVIGTLCCLISFAIINPFKDAEINRTHLQNEAAR
ncbi:phosphatase PAP2 family protein [Taibaiella koreensis]|uniref:phosphatase PAP2 family protein n=1 Tax=Taibaiella koreensis TaxID=1268548 RepID=UPI0013C2E24E|nr:phosphatase PAP2 family protein [Taibaiella koreensis]